MDLNVLNNFNAPTVVIMMLFILFAVSAVATFVVLSIANLIKAVVKQNKLHTVYKKKMIELKEFKDNGGIHKWVNNVAVVKSNNEVVSTHVCEHTGYVPAIDAFIGVDRIKQIAKQRARFDEYERFKNQRFEDISKKYEIKKHIIESLFDDLMSIKKDYTLIRLDNLKKELKEQGKNVKLTSITDEPY